MSSHDYTCMLSTTEERRRSVPTETMGQQAVASSVDVTSQSCRALQGFLSSIAEPYHEPVASSIPTMEVATPTIRNGKVSLSKEIEHPETPALRHTNPKSHQCKMCPKTFEYPSQLKRHVVSHAVGRSFNCSECNKPFKSQDTLNQHQDVHNGGKQFHCERCGKSFARSYGLKRHELTHTGNRPFSCRFCDNTYTERYDQLRHERSHERKKTWRYMYLIIIIILAAFLSMLGRRLWFRDLRSDEPRKPHRYIAPTPLCLVVQCPFSFPLSLIITCSRAVFSINKIQ